MKVLKIIHGYPPLYNAGSEVYSQLLCLGLAKNHEVVVFTREENPFSPIFSCRESTDHLNPLIKLHLINIPGENLRYRYRSKEVDRACEKLIETFQPDVVHIGHLNHLSTSLVEVIHQKKIPIVYTLHDYWLMCPRGQFIQRNSEELWQLCHKQENQICARNCYAGYFSGSTAEENEDVAYWTHWVGRRMEHISEIIKYIDIFIAPARYLLERYVNDFVISPNKIIYMDYGFDRARFKTLPKLNSREYFTFGYIGTHIPAKGIQMLIKAFGLIEGKAKLIIWGRPRGYNTASLHAICHQLPASKSELIEWKSEYANENIMEDVFQHIDCLVVPSIWVENSPLVIHEAQQARVPVITANVGGMAEYVAHEENGLLFEHRNLESLAKQMQRIITESDLASQLGKRGYIASSDGNIPDMETQVSEIEKVYTSLINQRKKNHEAGTLADHV